MKAWNRPVFRGSASRLTAIGASMLLTCISQTARAEEETSGAAQISEIVVTAQKRSERLLDVPEAVTVLNTDVLVANHQLTLDDYFRGVPGLTLYDNGNGFKELVIRGITTGNSDTPTVGVYIDDTPIGSSTALARGDVMVPDLDPSDLQRVEVLKGPQGTLYGSSNMGGLLKYVTVPPDSTSFSGRIGVDGETVDKGGSGYAVRAAVNIPLVEDLLAVRLSGSTRHDPGYIENVVDGARNVNDVVVNNGRIAALWTPTADLSVTLNTLFQERHAYGLGREDYNLISDQPIEGDLKLAQTPGTNHDKEELEIYNLTVDDNLGWAKLTSSSSFAKSSYNGGQDLSSLFSPILAPVFDIPNFGVGLNQSFGTDKFSQELRLAGQWASNVDWLAGAFYTHETSTFYQVFDPVYTDSGIPIGGIPLLLDTIGTSTYQEYAAFGDVTYHFTPQFDVQAGLRVSYNRQRAFFTNGGIDIFGGASVGYGTSSQTVPTFLFTPEYKLTDDLMVYARIASGYRAGGPNYTVPGRETQYQSDTTINYEIGVKQDLLDHTAHLEAAVFYINWHDVQLLGLNQFDQEFISNAGAAVSEGFELSGQYNIVRGLSVAANATYVDAHLTTDAPTGIYAPSGSRLPYSPRWSGQVSATYVFPLVNKWNGDIGGDYSYVSSRSGDFLSDPPPPGRPELPAYGVGNVHAGVDDGKYSADLWVHNVGNGRGLLAANSGQLSQQLDTWVATIIQPLTVGISVAAKF